MADDDIFGGDDFFNSNDFTGFDDLNDDDLESTPSFDQFGGADLGLATDDDDMLAMEFEEEEPGISRTFQLLIGAGIVVVFIIVIALILFAVLSGDDLSAGEQTATAAILTNTALAGDYNSTLTAIAQVDAATQTAVKQSEETATAVHFNQLTQEAQMTADAATAAALATQDAATFAAQTAAAEASANDATATALALNRLFGRALAEGNVPISGASLQLYKDDGDGVFSGSEMPVPTGPPGSTGDTGGDTGTGGETGTGSETGLGGNAAQPISYGQLTTGLLEAGETAVWTFTGSAGDVLIITAVSSNPSMDLFLRLYGPEGTVLAEDDNGMGNNDPMINNLALSANGAYILEVSSITGSGNYTLSLSLGLSSPGTDAEEIVPTQDSGGTGYNIGTGKDGGLLLFAKVQAPAETGGLMRQDPTATPGLTTDQLVDIITTGTGGEFDFGSLEPGTYWLVIDYNSLTPDLQAIIPPTAQLVFRVSIPAGGEFSITVVELTATPTPAGTLTEFDQTATAFFERTGTVVPLTPGDGGIVTLTPTDEFAGTITVTMPDTGIFDDIGSGDSDLDGTGGLTVLAIAAAGLVAVVFIARRLRSSH